MNKFILKHCGKKLLRPYNTRIFMYKGVRSIALFPTSRPNTFQKCTMHGFSLVEIMVGLTLGVILSIAVIGVYLAQKNLYKTNVSQAAIQSSESAIAALITPTIRNAGYCGCSSILQAVSNLNTGGPAPIGTIGTNPSMIMGYDAAAGTNITISQVNAANSTQASAWSSSLDSSLVGNVQATSDVVIVIGGTLGSQPIGVTTINTGSTTMILQNASGIASGQLAAVSDCAKASVFLVTAVAGTTISHAAGTGALTNATSALVPSYDVGAQFISLTQTAFFVARDTSGQSALMRATLNQNGTWTLQSLIPGVDTMQVLYGIGTNGIPTQYVPASGVGNWAQVYAVRLGFLIEGQQGSGTKSPTQYTVLGTTVTVPADNRLRHVYEMTIALRNSTS